MDYTFCWSKTTLNNQQVAIELLSSEGAMVTVANNGLEALNAVAADKHQYHLILMDLQMPIMDGYTATQRFDKTSDVNRSLSSQ